LIYSIPIIILRRFHQSNNVLTVNSCCATILCCFTWAFLTVISTSDSLYEIFWDKFQYLEIAQHIFTIEVPFSFVIGSLHRYCTLVYHTRPFFRKKIWLILCIVCQWLTGLLLSIPYIVCIMHADEFEIWPYIYAFTCVVIVSSHVRSSSRRIQPQIQQPKLNQRDLSLLRHMTIMYCMFIGGWAPIYLIPIISFYVEIDPSVTSFFLIWCAVGLLLDVVDLYLYNYELRKYFKETCFCCNKI